MSSSQLLRSRELGLSRWHYRLLAGRLESSRAEPLALGLRSSGGATRERGPSRWTLHCFERPFLELAAGRNRSRVRRFLPVTSRDIFLREELLQECSEEDFRLALAGFAGSERDFRLALSRVRGIVESPTAMKAAILQESTRRKQMSWMTPERMAEIARTSADGPEFPPSGRGVRRGSVVHVPGAAAANAAPKSESGRSNLERGRTDG